jgi:hypothetical protein
MGPERRLRLAVSLSAITVVMGGGAVDIDDLERRPRTGRVVDDRDSTAVGGWLAERSPEWRERVNG